ncbi:hypothetical protein OESDEN_17945 [Oesophagostomum dentatum]|uniref:Uncharacterized protein n=1 Tax=Oesophagostomum dentatum TaxID=61180 RepID=A0A0B1SEN5_OESDE|nr:hypothetical protein OESDEN_17945 [Oesophagostomum dentatum]
MPNFTKNSEFSDITPEIVVDKLAPRCTNVVYRDDPTQEVFMQLLRTAYASELWSLAETDLRLWKAAFGERFRMLVAYDEGMHLNP